MLAATGELSLQSGGKPSSLFDNPSNVRRTLYGLVDRQFLRRNVGEVEKSVETYHARVRDAVLQRLPDTRYRNRHLRLAETMASTANADVLRLVEHYLEGGAHERAAEHARHAGKLMAQRLSFEDAAAYFAVALKYKEWAGERTSLILEHADALADAGMSAESATRYLDAIDGSSANRGTVQRSAAGIRAKAAKQYLNAV